MTASAGLNTELQADGLVDLGDLPELLGYAIRRAQTALFDDFHRTLAPLALRPAEFSVLRVVQRNPGLRQRRVGEALGIQAPNLVGLVNRLARRGLVERRSNPEDGRSVALHLTEAGRALLDMATTLVQRHDAHIARALSNTQRRQLIALLHAVGA